MTPSEACDRTGSIRPAGATADPPIKPGAGPVRPGAVGPFSIGSMTRHGEWGLDDTLKLTTSCPPELGRFGDRE